MIKLNRVTDDKTKQSAGNNIKKNSFKKKGFLPVLKSHCGDNEEETVSS